MKLNNVGFANRKVNIDTTKLRLMILFTKCIISMEKVNKAYQKWDKERTEEAKELWYNAVRRFSEIHSHYTTVEHKRNRH